MNESKQVPIELLLCPFCGNTPSALAYTGQPAIANGWSWTCGCGASGPTGDMASSVERWNCRPQPASAALPLQTDLHSIGGQMANVLFNWSQEDNAVGGMLKPEDRELLKRLQSQWDVAARASRKASEPATTQEASDDAFAHLLDESGGAWTGDFYRFDSADLWSLMRACAALRAPLSGAGEPLRPEEYDLTKANFDEMRSEVRFAISAAESAAHDLATRKQRREAQEALDEAMGAIAYAESVATTQFERGRRKGMTQERALWMLAESGQEIERMTAAGGAGETLTEEEIDLVLEDHDCIPWPCEHCDPRVYDCVRAIIAKLDAKRAGGAT